MNSCLYLLTGWIRREDAAEERCREKKEREIRSEHKRQRSRMHIEDPLLACHRSWKIQVTVGYKYSLCKDEESIGGYRH
jgi:hypothetical protein